MNAETVKAISDALTPLANKLGAGGAQYFEWAVRHSLVVGWTNIALGAACAVGMVWTALASVRTFPRYLGTDNYSKEAMVSGAKLIVFCILFTAFAIVTFTLLPNGFERVFAPEYTAIQDIIGSVR